MFHKRKKVLHILNEMRVSKWGQNFNFGMNYPFKIFEANCLLNIQQNQKSRPLPEHFDLAQILCIAPASFIYQSENEKKTA